MKATLEFNLPEDEVEFAYAAHGNVAFSAIEEFGEYLRGQEKHGDPPDDIHKIRQRWYEAIGEVPGIL